MTEIKIFADDTYGIILPYFGQWANDDFPFRDDTTYPLVMPLVGLNGVKLNPYPITPEWEAAYRALNAENWNDLLWKAGIPSSITGKQPDKFQANICALNYVRIMGEDSGYYRIGGIPYDSLPDADINYLTDPYLVQKEVSSNNLEPKQYFNLKNDVEGYNYNILPKDGVAYLKKEWVQLFPELPVDVRVRTAWLRVRNKPTTNSETIGWKIWGQTVRVIAYDFEGHNIWGRFYLEDGSFGWIALRWQPKEGLSRVDEFTDWTLGIFNGPPRPKSYGMPGLNSWWKSTALPWLNVREGPGTNYKIVARLLPTKWVYITEYFRLLDEVWARLGNVDQWICLKQGSKYYTTWRD